MKLISSLTTLGVVAGAIPVVATACDSGDKVNSDYEIVCDTLGTTTADQNKTLVLQPGQVANFSMRYKGSDMTEQERKLILWTVNITRADNSNFKLVFADNLLNSPGSGCLYLPYTSADFLSPNEVVNFEVSAYDTVTANLLQRKSYSLSKARKTYSPTVTNGGAPDNNYALSLLNTMQFTSTGFNDTTKSVTLGLVCDDNTTPVSSVLWEIDTSLTISSVLNCVTLNKDSGVLTATIPADKQVVGYIVVSASFTDSENNSVKIFFISGISVGPYGIEYNKPINEGSSIEVLNYGDCIFMKKPNSAIGSTLELLRANNMDASAEGTILTSKFSGSINSYLNLVFDSTTNKYKLVFKDSTPLSAFSLGEYTGAITLSDEITSDVLAKRWVSLSIVSDEVFTLLKALLVTDDK